MNSLPCEQFEQLKAFFVKSLRERMNTGLSKNTPKLFKLFAREGNP